MLDFDEEKDCYLGALRKARSKGEIRGLIQQFRNQLRIEEAHIEEGLRIYGERQNLSTRQKAFADWEIKKHALETAIQEAILSDVGRKQITLRWYKKPLFVLAQSMNVAPYTATALIVGAVGVGLLLSVVIIPPSLWRLPLAFIGVVLVLAAIIDWRENKRLETHSAAPQKDNSFNDL